MRTRPNHLGFVQQARMAFGTSPRAAVGRRMVTQLCSRWAPEESQHLYLSSTSRQAMSLMILIRR